MTAIAHLAGFVAIPGVVDRFVVAPAEAARQLPYLDHNLERRAAFLLDSVVDTGRQLDDGIDTLDAHPRRLAHPAGDVARLAGPLQVLQGRTATRITDVDLDRYEVDGELRPVMVAARSSSRGDLPESGWVQEHLVYTHGDGVVAVPADVPTPTADPTSMRSPTTLVPDRTELYFGEGVRRLVRDRRDEARRAGRGGVRRRHRHRHLVGVPAGVLTLATGEIEPLFSAELTSDSSCSTAAASSSACRR